jgi:hypothetical protein
MDEKQGVAMVCEEAFWKRKEVRLAQRAQWAQLYDCSDGRVAEDGERIPFTFGHSNRI